MKGRKGKGGIVGIEVLWCPKEVLACGLTGKVERVQWLVEGWRGESTP